VKTLKEGEIDWARVTEMQQRLEELEAEKRERTKIFNPKELVRKAKQIREIVDEDLGTIRYVLLSYNELIELAEKYKDNRDRSIALLWKQLAPANEGLTFEEVKEMPYEVVVRLLMKLQTQGSFFPQKKPFSASGLALVDQRRQSDSSPMSTDTP
jgi:hypothetical protein